MPPERVDALVSASLEAARRHALQGRPIEARLLIDAALRVAPQREDLRALRERMGSPTGEDSVKLAGWLGSNSARTYPAHRSAGVRGFLYLPDRFFDLWDCVTVELHVGPGLYFDPHVTRAIQLGGGVRDVTGLGMYGGRSILGGRVQRQAGLTLLTAGVQENAALVSGAAGVRSSSSTIRGFHRPRDRYYQELEDYWALGSSLTAGYLGFTLDVHPLQIVDFVTGLAGIDFLNDDFASHRPLRLEPGEERLLMRMSSIERAPRAVSAYRSWWRRQTATERSGSLRVDP